MSATGIPHAKRQRLLRSTALSVAITLLLVLPIAVVATELLAPTPAVWAHLWATLLPEMLRNTLLLALAVGLGTLTLGGGLAWLVSAYRFSGRAAFDRLLLLPLAMPAYVLAFVFVATFDYAGPVQSALRAWLGPALWLPPIRSGAGAALVLSLVLYPYVYLLARTAFRDQSATLLDAARGLGSTPGRIVLGVVLPLARPALAAGVTLAMLEATTDFATARLFSFLTLSEGIFRVWEGMMDRGAAAELAGALLLLAGALIVLERALRGQARFYQAGGRARPLDPAPLHGWRGWAATGVCILVLGLAFVLPAAQLLAWSLAALHNQHAEGLALVYPSYVLTTLGLAALAAASALLLALVLAYGVRNGGRTARLGARLATLGYAVPGAVIAVGVLLTLAAADGALGALLARWQIRPGLLLTGSVTGLIYAYLVRFMAVAYGSVDSSMERVTPALDEAARSLGSTPRQVLLRIHTPLIGGGAATAAALVFIDVAKELPATLLLRPFGMDTLAVWTYMLAAESLWQAAAVPALTILALGILPVTLLLRKL